MGRIKSLIARYLLTVIFLAVLSMDCFSSGLFVKLVHFRALSGWEDEIAFDSLSFEWNSVKIAFFLLDGAALTGILLSFFVSGFYQLYGSAVALMFLANVVYPWGMAIHYVRSFHFILLFGMLMNGFGFIILAFLKKKTGLLATLNEATDG